MAVIADLQRLEARYAMPTYARAPVEFVRGEGARLWDSDGNEYLDFFAGLSVHNAGHCHPAIVDAITEQAARFAGSSNLYYSEPALRLVRRAIRPRDLQLRVEHVAALAVQDADVAGGSLARHQNSPATRRALRFACIRTNLLLPAPGRLRVAGAL